MNTKIDFKELLNKNRPDLTGKLKSFSSTDFWYYTSFDTASNILYSNSFWVSNLSMMNDESEKELHRSNSKKVHALCFCNSNTEKIPMWYLYAGLAGQGVSIGFTPAVMRDFIKSIDYVKVVGSKTILEKNIDFELQVGWVFYRKHDNVVKCKGKFYEIPESDAVAFAEDNYFIKDYPWEYEKEFRFIFVNKTDVPVPRLAVEFSDSTLSKLKIRLGPEMNKEDVQEKIFKDKGFKKYLFHKLLNSNLKIKMDLLNRNRKSIVTELPSIIREYMESIKGDDVALQELKEISEELRKILGPTMNDE